MSLVTSEPSGVVGRCDSGSKPSKLYEKSIWKIENFSRVSDRELRSHVFEVGNYKWYLLMYPQGCDDRNYLSLFLCVANHKELLPGWSHLAQFTISLVNIDSKKTVHSDTLHQFWKKEHDWGWKKFICLARLYEGFIDHSDSLIVNVQVHVVRECVDRPFRCLDNYNYRMEILRVYLNNVEQIFLLFVEEKRNKLARLIEDKKRWKSLCSFWLGMDENSRLELSREKMDVILKLVVKHFFIKKEVTSTLVMDFLFNGLMSLEGRYITMDGLANIVANVLLDDSSTSNKDSLDDRMKNFEGEAIKKERTIDAEETQAPIVRVNKDMFVLADDMMPLLKRFVLASPPRKELGIITHHVREENYNMKHDEKRLTEFGRWTLEVFALDHIFNKTEVAYKEAIALTMQEELIREEGKKKNKVK